MPFATCALASFFLSSRPNAKWILAIRKGACDCDARFLACFLRAAGNRKPLTQCTVLPYSRDVQCHSHAANLCQQGGGCQCACTSSVSFSARCARCCVHLVLRKCILPLVLCPGKLNFTSLCHGWRYHLPDVAQVSGLGAQTMALGVCFFCLACARPRDVIGQCEMVAPPPM